MQGVFMKRHKVFYFSSSSSLTINLVKSDQQQDAPFALVNETHKTFDFFFFLLYFSKAKSCVIQTSMSLKFEPFSEPLYNSGIWFQVDWFWFDELVRTPGITHS